MSFVSRNQRRKKKIVEKKIRNMRKTRKKLETMNEIEEIVIRIETEGKKGKEIEVKKETTNEAGAMREVEIEVEVRIVIEEEKIVIKEEKIVIGDDKTETENWMRMSNMKNENEKESKRKGTKHLLSV